MIAYELHLNGKHVATAGLPQGVVAATANWVFVPNDIASDPEKDWCAGINLSGLDHETGKHLDWFHSSLKVGDEITLKLVEVDQADTPGKPLAETSKMERDRILKKEFGDFEKRSPGCPSEPSPA